MWKFSKEHNVTDETHTEICSFPHWETLQPSMCTNKKIIIVDTLLCVLRQSVLFLIDWWSAFLPTTSSDCIRNNRITTLQLFHKGVTAAFNTTDLEQHSKSEHVLLVINRGKGGPLKPFSEESKEIPSTAYMKIKGWVSFVLKLPRNPFTDVQYLIH